MKIELMKVPMIIMDWEKCLKAFPKLTKNMLCAGYENESFDACQVTKEYSHPHLQAPIISGLPMQGYLLFTENRQQESTVESPANQSSTVGMGT